MTRYQKSRFSYTLFVKMFSLFYYWSVKEPSSGSRMNSINQRIFYTLEKEISSNILTEHCKLRFLHKRYTVLFFPTKAVVCCVKSSPVAGNLSLTLLNNWIKFSSLYKVAYKLENEQAQSPFRF